MIKKKMIEVRVCDKCGRELETDFAVCPVCHRDLCAWCRAQYIEPAPNSQLCVSITYYCTEHLPANKEGRNK